MNSIKKIYKKFNFDTTTLIEYLTDLAFKKNLTDIKTYFENFFQYINNNKTDKNLEYNVVFLNLDSKHKINRNIPTIEIDYKEKESRGKLKSITDKYKYGITTKDIMENIKNSYYNYKSKNNTYYELEYLYNIIYYYDILKNTQAVYCNKLKFLTNNSELINIFARYGFLSQKYGLKINSGTICQV